MPITFIHNQQEQVDSVEGSEAVEALTRVDGVADANGPMVLNSPKEVGVIDVAVGGDDISVPKVSDAANVFEGSGRSAEDVITPGGTDPSADDVGLAVLDGLDPSANDVFEGSCSSVEDASALEMPPVTPVGADPGADDVRVPKVPDGLNPSADDDMPPVPDDGFEGSDTSVEDMSALDMSPMSPFVDSFTFDMSIIIVLLPKTSIVLFPKLFTDRSEKCSTYGQKITKSHLPCLLDGAAALKATRAQMKENCIEYLPEALCNGLGCAVLLDTITHNQ
jgi:hypothetical protein